MTERDHRQTLPIRISSSGATDGPLTGVQGRVSIMKGRVQSLGSGGEARPVWGEGVEGGGGALPGLSGIE